MAPEPRRLVARITFLLVILAAVATEVAADDTRPVETSLGQAAGWIVAALIAARFVPQVEQAASKPPAWVGLLLVLLGLAPFVIEPLRREWLGEGYPLELQMVVGLRNVGLALAVFSGWMLCLRLAAVVSLFLTLFAVAMTDHPAVLVLLGLYTAGGSVWLMLVYWAGLPNLQVASDYEVSLEVQAGRERLPWVSVFIVMAMVGCMLGLIAVGPTRAAYALGELLATSGGTGAYDPFSRGGVNDGDDEIKGENAKSTGMTQTETFLESPLPSLYDLTSDTFGEPFKSKDQERTLALDAREKFRESEKPPAENLRPNREFSTNRRRPRESRDPGDRGARALFEVVGRAPLHVRVTAYDRFDGVNWKEEAYSVRGDPLVKEPHGYWFQVGSRSSKRLFNGRESHQFKMTTSQGSLVPTPPHVCRLRLGRIDQADFFGWTQEGILRMTSRNLPSGVTVETECDVVDPARLPSARPICNPRHLDPLTGVDPRLAEMAREWAGEATGWAMVVSIVDRLKSEYQLDRTYRPPSECHDPLAHFLFEAKRGPDYQFATAATLLLRALGCRTRMACGFYVAPENYDRATRHTPVVAEDLHCWSEVGLISGEWLILEPTPGYDVLGPATPLSERLLAVLVAVGHWAWQHWLPLSLSLLTLGVVWWRRRELLDALLVLRWRCFPGRTWSDCVRGTMIVLEQRGRWAGRPRPASRTGFAWLRDRDELRQLARMAEWAAYAPQLPPPWPESEARLVCRQAIDRWTLPRWRAITKGEAR